MREKRKTSDKKSENLKFKKIAKKQKWQQQGITLIALVVTIIILLILSGVTLDIALSDNGLFKRAQEAADKYKKAQEDEEDILEELENQLDNLTSIRDAKASKYEFEKTRTLSDIKGTYFGLFSKDNELLEPLNYLNKAEFTNYLESSNTRKISYSIRFRNNSTRRNSNRR